MTSNTSYQAVPATGPMVRQTVVVPRMETATQRTWKVIVCVLIVTGSLVIVFGFVSLLSLRRLGFSFAGFLVFGIGFIVAGIYLWRIKLYSNSNRTISGAPVLSPSVTHTPQYPGQPLGYTLPQTYQRHSYPTHSAVPGGLLTSYTYTAPNQPTAVYDPPPPYPYATSGPPDPKHPFGIPTSGEGDSPPYLLAPGGQAAYNPMDQNPSIGAPVLGSFDPSALRPSGTYAPGLQGPPAAGTIPNLPEYQPPPAFAPSEEPPPYPK